MRRMGFSYSKPRPIPDKSASEEEQEKFKQETADMIRETGRQGYVVRVCDRRPSRSGLTQNTGGAVPAGTIPSDRDSPKNPRN